MIFKKLLVFYILTQNMAYRYRKQQFWSRKINFDNIWVKKSL